MSVTAKRAPVVLEPASRAFVEATAKPPFLYQLTPAEARKVVNDVQAAPVDKLAGLEDGRQHDGRPPHSLMSRLEER